MAESRRSLWYNGPPAAWTQREGREKAGKVEEINREIRKGWADSYATNTHPYHKEHLPNSWETSWKEPLPYPQSSQNYPVPNHPKILISQRCQEVIASQSSWDMTLIWNQILSYWVMMKVWLMTKSSQQTNMIEIGSHPQRESKGNLVNLVLLHS